MRNLNSAFVVLLGLIFATGIRAASADDEQQIRDVFSEHQNGWYEGNLEQILSTMSADFVSYNALSRPTNTWAVGLVGRDAFRDQADQGEGLEQAKNLWDAHPEWQRGHEVLHINIKEGQAIALTQHFSVQPDPEQRETLINEWQSVWMLAREDGTWKITSWISHTWGDQNVYRMPPQ